jgi:hypothetical protein
MDPQNPDPIKLKFKYRKTNTFGDLEVKAEMEIPQSSHDSTRLIWALIVGGLAIVTTYYWPQVSNLFQNPNSFLLLIKW